MTDQNTIKLTQYSHGAGCGCKISPSVLDRMLESSLESAPPADLLVGNEDRDDAAVYDLGDGTAVISTTDFFMPIVDDPFDFGRIAAANAISDVYAMGGKPMMAIAILGWPVDKLAPEVAREVLEGGRSICREAGIPLAGGHSIDSPEPIFGLAVTGRVNIGQLLTNATAHEGCKLFLTKALGVGILSTAQKQGKLREEDIDIARDSMVRLNDFGAILGNHAYVKSMTDVTGFGLLGHLVEMCEASKVSAEVRFNDLPRFDVLDHYLAEGCVPGGTGRNWESYGHKVSGVSEEQKAVLCDPQTSGGLLVAVVPEYEREFVELASGFGFELSSFGEMIPREEHAIRVI